MINIAFDMETNDPDDAFTLCILATHPKVNLVAVTITPGTNEQVGVVRKILAMANKTVPIGTYRLQSELSNKAAVSSFHCRWLGGIEASKPDNEGYLILSQAFENYPDAVLLTGAPLNNPGVLIRFDNLPICNKWVCQGGFAGDSVVPKELRLAKFDGKETCPTFNLNGNPKAALALIGTNRIKEKTLVSKNVCHGVVWDREMHERMFVHRYNYAGISIVFDAMKIYLEHKPTGKAFHDPLAACVAIDESICQYRKVKLYREKGEWGSRLDDLSDSRITISVDRQKFESTLCNELTEEAIKEAFEKGRRDRDLASQSISSVGIDPSLRFK
jgi:inosine-uridine nucleoside N-ribohydrolase